jgi:acetyl esterase/lipase
MMNRFVCYTLLFGLAGLGCSKNNTTPEAMTVPHAPPPAETSAVQAAPEASAPTASTASKDPRIDLVNANLKGLPPTTIINAEIDPLLSDGEKLAKALKEAGVDTTQKTLLASRTSSLAWARWSAPLKKQKSSVLLG